MFIEVQLICHVVSVSGIQRSESVIHTHVSTLLSIFPHAGHCRVFSRVPCTLQKVLITCKYLFLKKKMDGYFPVHSCTHSCMHSFIQKVLTEGVIHIGQ